jgi:hypothetical protein
VLLELTGVAMKKQTTNILWNFISKTKDLTEYYLKRQSVAITEN